MNLKRKKHRSPHLLLHQHVLTASPHQLHVPGLVRYWAQLAHPPSGGAGWAPGPHPPVTGLPSSTMHKKQRQKSVRREKTLSTSAEIDQSSLDLSKVLQKLLILQVTASLLKQETSRSSVKLSKWRWQLLYFWTVNGNRSGNSTPFWFFS